MKEALSQKNVAFDFIDITASMMNLKKFLRVRDTSEVHEMARQKHSVGVPCIMTDQGIYIAETPEDVDELLREGKLS